MGAPTNPLKANKAGYAHLAAQNWRSAHCLQITDLFISQGIAYNDALKQKLCH